LPAGCAAISAFLIIKSGYLAIRSHAAHCRIFLSAAGAERARGRDDPFDRRQMRRQLAAVAPPCRPRAGRLAREERRRLLLGGVEHALGGSTSSSARLNWSGSASRTSRRIWRAAERARYPRDGAAPRSPPAPPALSRSCRLVDQVGADPQSGRLHLTTVLAKVASISLDA
jgi:hypothetical protein